MTTKKFIPFDPIDGALNCFPDPLPVPTTRPASPTIELLRRLGIELDSPYTEDAAEESPEVEPLGEDPDADEVEDADGFGSPCPICGAHCCEEHLLLAIEVEEGFMAGTLCELADTWVSDTRDEIREALRLGTPDPKWPKQIRGINDRLARSLGWRHLRPTPEDEEEDANDQLDNEFSDVWLDARADSALQRYLGEWLAEQPGVEWCYEESSAGPGASWAWTSYYAEHRSQGLPLKW